MEALLLTAWLTNGQDYAQGLALAEHVPGVSTTLLQLLAQGANPFTRKKLRALLADAASGSSAGSDSEPTPTVVASAPGPAPLPTEAAPATVPALEALKAARLAGFKEASQLHARLRLTPDKAERYRMACRIKELFRLNQKQWDDQEYYKTYGFFPPEHVALTLDPTDIAAVTTRRNSLRTYAKRGSQAQRATWQAELLALDRILQHG